MFKLKNILNKKILNKNIFSNQNRSIYQSFLPNSDIAKKIGYVVLFSVPLAFSGQYLQAKKFFDDEEDGDDEVFSILDEEELDERTNEEDLDEDEAVGIEEYKKGQARLTPKYEEPEYDDEPQFDGENEDNDDDIDEYVDDDEKKDDDEKEEEIIINFKLKKGDDKEVYLPSDRFNEKVTHKRDQQIIEEEKKFYWIEEDDVDERLKRLGILDEKELEQKRINNNIYGKKTTKTFDPNQYIRNYKRTKEQDSAGEREDPPIEWDEEARISGGPNHPNPFYGWQINDTDMTRYALLEHFKGNKNAWHHYMTDRTKVVECTLSNKKGRKFAHQKSFSNYVEFPSKSNNSYARDLLDKTNVAMIEWNLISNLKKSGVIDPNPMALEEMNAVYKYDKIINQIYMPYGNDRENELIRMKDQRSFETNKYRPIQLPVIIEDFRDYTFYKGLFKGALDVTQKRVAVMSAAGNKTQLLIPEFKKRARKNIWPDSWIRFMYNYRSNFQMTKPSTTTYTGLNFKNSQRNISSNKVTQQNDVSGNVLPSFKLPTLIEIERKKHSDVTNLFNQVVAGTALLTASSLFFMVAKKPKGGPFRQPTPKTLKRAFSVLRKKPQTMVQVLPKEKISLDYTQKFFDLKTTTFTNSLSDRLRFKNSKMFFDWTPASFKNNDLILIYDVPTPIVEKLVPALLDADDDSYLITNQDFVTDENDSEWKLVGKVLDFPETLFQRNNLLKILSTGNPESIEAQINESDVIQILAENDEGSVKSQFTVGDLEIKELSIYQKNPNPSVHIPSTYELDKMIQDQFREILQSVQEREDNSFSSGKSSDILGSINQIYDNQDVKVDEYQMLKSKDGSSSTQLNKFDWDFPVVKNDFLNFMLKGKSKIYKARDMYEFFPKFEKEKTDLKKERERLKVVPELGDFQKSIELEDEQLLAKTGEEILTEEEIKESQQQPSASGEIQVDAKQDEPKVAQVQQEVKPQEGEKNEVKEEKK